MSSLQQPRASALYGPAAGGAAGPAGALYSSPNVTTTPGQPSAVSNSPRLSPSKPAPAYDKIATATDDISESLSRLGQGAQVQEVLQAVVECLGKLIPYASNVAKLGNSHANNFAGSGS